MTAEPPPLEALARVADGGWLVGGAVRDRLLQRRTTDYDIATTSDPKQLARALAREANGHPFRLSEGFGAWRVVARDRSWQVDVLPLAGDSIEDDLALRDFTVNALAMPLAGGAYVDPFGGRSDLRAGRLRMVSEEAFARDPLRIMRLARLACELGFEPEPQTRARAPAAAPGLSAVAPERVFSELKRIIAADAAVHGLELMDELGATAAVLPELLELRGVEQSKYHHLDVHDHTQAVLGEAIALSRDPQPALGDELAPAVASVLSQPVGDELTRWAALRFGALFHDMAKPRTRAMTSEGRVTFVGHDVTGAEMVRAILGRLRASERLTEHVAALTRHHLRLGFLVHDMPLGPRPVYRYLRDTEPVAVDVTLLSVADRLATRGSGSERAIARHLELARQLLGAALRWQREPPRPPLRGDELARAVGLRPGPELGRLLAELQEASYAGEIAGREEAVALARDLLGKLPEP